jgi:hypothetical protein
MKKKLIIIGIVVIVAIAIYFAWKKYKKPSSNNSQGNQDNPSTQYNINDISENTLKELSKSISEKDSQDTISIIDALKKDTKMPQNEKDMFLRVWKGILYAKKDKNWDDKSKDVAKKKQTLAAYGVKENEIDWFIKRTA